MRKTSFSQVQDMFGAIRVLSLMKCKQLTDSVVASVIPQYEFLRSLLGVTRTSLARRQQVL